MIQQKIDMEATGQAYREARQAVKRRVIVCAGTGCVANGSLKVFEALNETIAAKGLDVVGRAGPRLQGRRLSVQERLPGVLPGGSAGDDRA